MNILGSLAKCQEDAVSQFVLETHKLPLSLLQVAYHCMLHASENTYHSTRKFKLVDTESFDSTLDQKRQKKAKLRGAVSLTDLGPIVNRSNTRTYAIRNQEEVSTRADGQRHRLDSESSRMAVFSRVKANGSLERVV